MSETQVPMPPLPPGLAPYSSTREFTQDTVPKGLLARHCTKAGTWGRIVVLSGRLRYTLEQPLPGESEIASWVLEPGQDGSVFPERYHHVEPIGQVLFRVDFLKHS